jgi:hypothetical protein
MKIEAQTLRYISFCIAAVILQSAMLLTAALIWYGSIELPPAAAVIFAIFGVGSFAAAIFFGYKTVPPGDAQAEKAEIIAPPKIIAAVEPPGRQAVKIPQKREHFGDGNTAILFRESEHFTPPGFTERRDGGAPRLSWTANGAKRCQEVYTFPVIIGREAGLCAVVINDAKVSRQHAVITYVAGDLFISDGVNGTRSSNGTILDGKVITSETQIYSGQIIKLGNTEIKAEVIT